MDSVCKRGRDSVVGTRRRWPLWCSGAVCAVAACTAPHSRRTVTLAELEAAPSLPAACERIVSGDPDSLRELCRPIGERLGFLLARSAADWKRLARAAPELALPAKAPRGVLIGLASWTGTPLDGEWPVRLAAIRVCERAALVSFDVAGGNYLPDGATYLEAAYVEDVDDVLIVEVNGVRYYPD